MKKQLTILGAAAAIIMPLLGGASVEAWGPARETYTMDSPADHATLNSITDNAAVGDERDFVRIAEKGSGSAYTSDLTISPGKQYEVYVYYHNDASATYNDPAYDYRGVAWDVRFSTNFPDELAKDEVGYVWGKFTSTSTDPAAVWDEAYIKASEAMTLHFVAGSAILHNGFAANGSVLATAIFSTDGVKIGLDELNGMILGCDRYSGFITYTIQTKAVDSPSTEETPTESETPSSTPTPSDTSTETKTPSKLPETGPAEIFLASALILAVIAGIVYYTKMRKKVKKTTKKAKGKK